MRHKIENDPSYFSPIYSGTTEEFFSLVDVASVRISKAQVAYINAASGAIEAIDRLRLTIGASNASQNYIGALLRQVINEKGEFVADVTAGRQWFLKFVEEPIHVAITQLLETVELVGNSVPHTKVVFTT